MEKNEMNRERELQIQQKHIELMEAKEQGAAVEDALEIIEQATDTIRRKEDKEAIRYDLAMANLAMDRLNMIFEGADALEEAHLCHMEMIQKICETVNENTRET